MSNEIHLTEIKHSQGQSIECYLYACQLPSFPEEKCLVSAFSGVIEASDNHESGYGFMHATIGDGFAACNPVTLLLDLRQLKYESGNGMLGILDQRIITKVVASDLNRGGLNFLVSSVLFLPTQSILFDTIFDALIACDSAYDDLLRGGRKKIMAADF